MAHPPSLGPGSNGRYQRIAFGSTEHLGITDSDRNARVKIVDDHDANAHRSSPRPTTYFVDASDQLRAPTLEFALNVKAGEDACHTLNGTGSSPLIRVYEISAKKSPLRYSRKAVTQRASLMTMVSPKWPAKGAITWRYIFVTGL